MSLNHVFQYGLIKVRVGTVYGGRNSTVVDGMKLVEFTGEELATSRVPDYDGTRGTTQRLFRTEEGQLLVHEEDWSQWQGENTVAKLYKVTAKDLEHNGRFDRLGYEAGLQEALTWQQAAEELEA